MDINLNFSDINSIFFEYDYQNFQVNKIIHLTPTKATPLLPSPRQSLQRREPPQRAGSLTPLPLGEGKKERGKG